MGRQTGCVWEAERFHLGRMWGMSQKMEGGSSGRYGSRLGKRDDACRG